MECSQVYVLFTTRDSAIWTVKLSSISNFEVLLEVVVELLAQMVERAVVAGDWFEEFETNCLVEKPEWPWVEAQGIGFALLDSVVGAHC